MSGFSGGGGGGGTSVTVLTVQDEKAAGTDGGTFTSGAWQTRTLNTVKTNNISGASLASNQITLPAGTYVIHAQAPAFAVNNHRCKLYNVTDAADTLLGANTNASAASSVTTSALLSGTFTISGSKVFELRHYAQTTASTNGLGSQNVDGGVSIFATVMIMKIA